MSVVVIVGPASAQPTYDELRSAAVKKCAAIDPSKGETGLLFNPDGYRAYYERSRCFQEAAERFRDGTLCAEVRQRRSLLSSWGYSAGRCRTLVADGLVKDRTELEALRRTHLAGGMRFADVQVVRNGNGRDYDILPRFTGTHAHGYRITIEIVEPGAAPVLVHQNGYWVDATSRLNLYVRAADIRARFPAFTPGRRHPVRATVSLSIGNGGPTRYWSDAFLERVFPARERTHSITRDVEF